MDINFPQLIFFHGDLNNHIFMAAALVSRVICAPEKHLQGVDSHINYSKEWPLLLSMVIRSMFSIARVNKTLFWKIFKSCIKFGRAKLYLDVLEYIAMNKTSCKIPDGKLPKKYLHSGAH